MDNQERKVQRKTKKVQSKAKKVPVKKTRSANITSPKAVIVNTSPKTNSANITSPKATSVNTSPKPVIVNTSPVNETFSKECPICMGDEEEDLLELDCCHYMHSECSKGLGKAECPMCKAPITVFDKKIKLAISSNNKKYKAQNLEEEASEIREMLQDPQGNGFAMNDGLNEHGIVSILNHIFNANNEINELINEARGNRLGVDPVNTYGVGQRQNRPQIENNAGHGFHVIEFRQPRMASQTVIPQMIPFDDYDTVDDDDYELMEALIKSTEYM